MMMVDQLKVGITGSIGMGKSTIASEFFKLNIPVWSADDAVHELYKKGNDGYHLIKKLVSEAAVDGEVNRLILSNAILTTPRLLQTISLAIQPMIKLERLNFLKMNNSQKILVFDIPLLFETSCDNWLDVIITATAPKSIQRKRVLSRKSMTEDKFLHILASQLSNKEKIEKADFVINTSTSFPLLAKKVEAILEKLQNEYF